MESITDSWDIEKWATLKGLHLEVLTIGAAISYRVALASPIGTRKIARSVNAVQSFSKYQIESSNRGELNVNGLTDGPFQEMRLAMWLLWQLITPSQTPAVDPRSRR